MVKNLGLNYEKIDSWVNDCMLFTNDHMDDEYCHTCGASQYIQAPKVYISLSLQKNNIGFLQSVWDTFH